MLEKTEVEATSSRFFRGATKYNPLSFTVNENRHKWLRNRNGNKGERAEIAKLLTRVAAAAQEKISRLC